MIGQKSFFIQPPICADNADLIWIDPRLSAQIGGSYFSRLTFSSLPIILRRKDFFDSF
jgi:hypothetical protein